MSGHISTHYITFYCSHFFFPYLSGTQVNTHTHTHNSHAYVTVRVRAHIHRHAHRYEHTHHFAHKYCYGRNGMLTVCISFLDSLSCFHTLPVCQLITVVLVSD